VGCFRPLPTTSIPDQDCFADGVMRLGYPQKNYGWMSSGMFSGSGKEE
jgi:hypothetical protein